MTPPSRSLGLRFRGCGFALVACLVGGGFAHAAPATSPLAFSLQPGNRSLPAPGPVSFSVAAQGGTAPYSYQWFKGNEPIPGAVSATFTFTAAAADAASIYHAQVVDATGAVANSQRGALSITPAPVRDWSGFVPPTITFKDSVPGTEGSTILHNAIPDIEGMMKEQCLAICKEIYADNSDSRVTFGNLTLELISDPKGIAAKGGSDGVVAIVLSTEYVAKFYASHGQANDLVLKEIRGILAHEGTHGYQWVPKNCGEYDGSSVCWGFIEGEADGVRGDLTNWTPVRHPHKGGNWNDGYNTTGFFLDWCQHNKKATFMVELNHAARDMATFSWDSAFQLILGEGVQTVWDQYQASL